MSEQETALHAVKPYPGNVAEDCKAAMAPSLAGVFQQFNEIFGTGQQPAAPEQADPVGQEVR